MAFHSIEHSICFILRCVRYFSPGHSTWWKYEQPIQETGFPSLPTHSYFYFFVKVASSVLRFLSLARCLSFWVRCWREEFFLFPLSWAGYLASSPFSCFSFYTWVLLIPFLHIWFSFFGNWTQVWCLIRLAIYWSWRVCLIRQELIGGFYWSRRAYLAGDRSWQFKTMN